MTARQFHQFFFTNISGSAETVRQLQLINGRQIDRLELKFGPKFQCKQILCHATLRHLSVIFLRIYGTIFLFLNTGFNNAKFYFRANDLQIINHYLPSSQIKLTFFLVSFNFTFFIVSSAMKNRALWRYNESTWNKQTTKHYFENK